MWTYRVDELQNTRWRGHQPGNPSIFVVMEPSGRDDHFQWVNHLDRVRQYCATENKRLSTGS